MSADWAWGVEWIWVSGYSAAATTIVLLNLVLFISVVRNRYLHYTFNYVVFSLSFRNICRVGFTLYLVLLGKLSQSTEEFAVSILPGGTPNFTDYQEVPLLCDLTSMADNCLTSSNMLYLAFLSLYLFCRQPNPPAISPNIKTLKLYGLSCGIVPIQESWWLAPLLILTPLCLSVCLSLPALLLHLPHPMSAIPGGQLCLTTQPDTLQQQMTYHSSLAILGFCLPLAIIICLVIGLSVRRCVSCYTTICVSSFCKEELLLALLTLPVTASQLLLFLPVLDRNLLQLQLPVSGVADLVSPTTARILEMLSSGALPLLAFSLLPAYSSWTARPDGDDMRWGYRRTRRDQSTNAPDSRRDSLTSFGFDMN